MEEGVPPASLSLRVQPLNGARFTIEVGVFATVADAKQRIASHLGCSSDSQLRLTHSETGATLEDDSARLTSCDVRDGDCLWLVVRHPAAGSTGPEPQPQADDEPSLLRQSSGVAETVAAADSEAPCICVIGETGAGKSAFCNSLVGSRGEVRSFPESGGAKSMTAETTVMRSCWFGDPSQSAVTVVDTPGLSDSGGADVAHLRGMVTTLQEVGSVHVFFIVFNGQSPRMSEHLRSMLQMFAAVFGGAFLSNVALVFTRWSMDGRSQRRRGAPGQSEADRAYEFSGDVADALGAEPRVLPCLFVDTEVPYVSSSQAAAAGAAGGVHDDFDAAELEAMRRALEQAKQLATSQPPFLCESMSDLVQRLRELRGQVEVLEREEAQAQQRLEAVEQQRVGEVAALRQEVLDRDGTLAQVREELATAQREKNEHFTSGLQYRARAEEERASLNVQLDAAEQQRASEVASLQQQVQNVDALLRTQVQETYKRHKMYEREREARGV